MHVRVVASAWGRHTLNNFCEEWSHRAFSFEAITAHAIARLGYEPDPLREQLSQDLPSLHSMLGEQIAPILQQSVVERDGDRDDGRPLPAWHAIEVADELRQKGVRKQFCDDQLRERAWPWVAVRTNSRIARGRHSSRHCSASSCCFTRCGVFELTLEVEE